MQKKEFLSIEYYSKSKNFSIAMFAEEFKPLVLEKHELEYSELSRLIAFWHARTIMILMQGAKSIF